MARATRSLSAWLCLATWALFSGGCGTSPATLPGSGGSPPEPEDGGPPPGCEAGLTDCEGACLDLGSDGQNCGACGRDCGGTKCVDGMCEALVVYEGGKPVGIAVDESYLYVVDVDSSSLLRMSKSGAAPETIAPAGCWDIAVDATHIYMGRLGFKTGTIVSVPKAGGTPTILAIEQTNPSDVAVDDTHVYWRNESLATGIPALASVPKAGGDVLVLGPLDSMVIRGMTIGEGYAFAGNRTTGEVFRVPLAGGEAELIDNSGIDPNDHRYNFNMTVSGGTLYYSQFVLNKPDPFRQVQLSGGESSAISTSVEWVGTLIADATHLFRIGTPGWVYSARLEAPADAKPIAFGAVWPYKMVVDEKFVYWTEPERGHVLRAPR